MQNNQILTLQQLVQKVNELEESIKNANPYMTSAEVINYTKLSKSTLDILCHKKLIPYSKPNNKNRYFKKTDIDNYLMNNSISIPN